MRAALSVSARGEAEPGHTSRADAEPTRASSNSSKSRKEEPKNRSVVERRLASDHFSFVDVEQWELYQSTCRIFDKTDAKLFAVVIGGAIFVSLCAVVCWVVGTTDPGGPKRPPRNQGPPPVYDVDGRTVIPPQYAPPPSPGTLQGVVPNAAAYPAPGPTPQWWVTGPPVAQPQAAVVSTTYVSAAPSPVAAAPVVSPPPGVGGAERARIVAGGSKDETVLFDTYEYRRSSRRSENFH